MSRYRGGLLTLDQGPWEGMFYAHPGDTSGRRCYHITNGYVDENGSISSRPGTYRIASSALAGAGQLVYQFTKLDGTQYTVVIAGGKFYTLNWSTGVFTEVLTASDLSGASITLSSTARCYAVTLANQMIVSDGVNTPWMWDGTTGSGLTKLTNAPVFYGQPTVYVTKLFGIKNTDRGTIVWSNENDPENGYEAGVNQAWTLGQTSSDPLFAIRGTNYGLYYFRQRSVGVVVGAFDDEFRTSSTHDSVSDIVGTRSPAGVLYYGSAFYFPDEYGRPTMFTSGGTAQPIWKQVALLFPNDTILGGYGSGGPTNASVTASDIAVYETLPFRTLGGVLFRYSTGVVGGKYGVGAQAYFTAAGIAYGFWGPTPADGPTVGGEVINSTTNLPEILEIDTLGNSFSTGKPGQWCDVDSSGANVVVNFNVMTARLANNPVLDIHFDQAFTEVDARAAGSVSLTLFLLNSRQQLATFSGLSATATSSVTQEEKRVGFGLAKQGRWAQFGLTMVHTSAAAATFPLRLHKVAVIGVPATQGALTP